jgi:RimJ/RimL family protein N-acetyltransferase
VTWAIPTLATPRLRLRAFQPGDLAPLAAIHADPQVMRYVGDGRAQTREQTWRSMATHLGHWRLRGFGNWAVVERATGRLIGRAGLWQPEGWPGLEVGWALARPCWGRGLATEAARASLDWAFSELGADHVISLIAPANERSRRVAERLGERLEGTTRIRGHEVQVFGIHRPHDGGGDA